MIILRVLAGILCNPLLMGFVIVGVGLLLLQRMSRRTGVWLIAGGLLFAYLASTSLIGNALLGPLERNFPSFEPTQAMEVHDIVVLGSGYEPQDHIPVTGALDADGLARVVEGVRLARARPSARLLLSGGSAPGHSPIALGYAEMAVELGIPRSVIVIMDRALDTAQEARDVAALLGRSPFILVTSAYHMP